MPLEGVRYIDEEKLKRQLFNRDDVDDHDAMLTDICLAVEARADKIIEPRLLDRAERTEFYDGDDYGSILLNAYPIASVAAVYLDCDLAFDESTLQAADTYTFDRASGLLKRRGSAVWPAGTGNVKVTYAGGIDPFPPDVEHALRVAVADDFMRCRRLHGGQEQNELTFSMYMGARQESYQPEFDHEWGLPKRCVAALMRYRT